MGETMNTIYDKPLIYLFIHFALGVASAWYNWIIYTMVIYQVVQLILGKRFFLFEWELKDGNSVKHTSVKLIEFFIGYAIGTAVRFSRLS